jgi:hypothetical protein
MADLDYTTAIANFIQSNSALANDANAVRSQQGGLLDSSAANDFAADKAAEVQKNQTLRAQLEEQSRNQMLAKTY